MDADSNLFLILGKYVERQEENMLTQSLAALFNNCSQFREEFIALLRRRSLSMKADGLDAGTCRALTQQPKHVKNTRIIVDMTIHNGVLTLPRYWIEAKVTAPLTAKQAKNYANTIMDKKRSSSAQLVIISLSGEDAEVAKVLRCAVWISWTQVADLALIPSSRKTKSERMLCTQFYDMLKEKGIPMIPGIQRREYNRLAKLRPFDKEQKRIRLKMNTVDPLRQVMARLEEFTQRSWGSLRERGYKPYAYITARRPEKGTIGQWHTVIEVGYSRPRNRKRVKTQWICIELEERKLYVVAGITIGNGHPENNASRYEYKQFKQWSLLKSYSLFHKSLSGMEREFQTELDRCLKAFKQSRFARM